MENVRTAVLTLKSDKTILAYIRTSIKNDSVNIKIEFDNSKYEIGELNAEIENNSYFISRIFIKKPYRNLGIGRFLIEQMIYYADINHMRLAVIVNPYGEMSFSKLTEIILEYGFVLESNRIKMVRPAN